MPALKKPRHEAFAQAARTRSSASAAEENAVLIKKPDKTIKTRSKTAKKTGLIKSERIEVAKRARRDEARRRLAEILRWGSKAEAARQLFRIGNNITAIDTTGRHWNGFEFWWFGRGKEERFAWLSDENKHTVLVRT